MKDRRGDEFQGADLEGGFEGLESRELGFIKGKRWIWFKIIWFTGPINKNEFTFNIYTYTQARLNVRAYRSAMNFSSNLVTTFQLYIACMRSTLHAT